MPENEGLRERKRQATRQAISDIATRLFIERGFDNVTISEIADAANVARMTVFNYFSRKEDLFFDREDDAMKLVRDAMSNRSPKESPIHALRNLARQMVEQKHPLVKFTAGTAGFWKAVADSPALSARARELRDLFVHYLAAAMSGSVGRGQADPEARLAAAMFAATWTVSYAEGLRQHRKGSHHARQVFLALMERGLDGIAASLTGTPYLF